MNFLTAWNDFYNSQQPTPINKQKHTSRLSLSDASVYVSNCLFESITSTSNGGALCCSSSVTYLLVESSSFFTCKTSGTGGAIYFANTNSGQSVLREVCGNNCCTTSSSDGQFTRIDVKNNATSKNYVNYSSITRCVNEGSSAWFMLCICNGKICCPSVNITMNKCGYRSGIYYTPFSDSNSVTGSLSYSTFTDNTAAVHGCIRFEGALNYEIKCCNILRNTQGSLNEHGTIITDYNLKIEDSCILENVANYIFFQSSSSSSYKITLSNCTVDKTTNNGYLTIQNKVTKSFILTLNHMSTQNCHAEYYSAGCPTPITQLCYTCKNHFHLPRMREIVSLISLLIFNFIHIHSSGDSRF
jgi:hypothetical protein